MKLEKIEPELICAYKVDTEGLSNHFLIIVTLCNIQISLPMIIPPIQSANLMSGKWSQKGDTSSGDRINLVDATDGIKNGGQIPPNASGDGVLLLADGSRFTGKIIRCESLG